MADRTLLARGSASSSASLRPEPHRNMRSVSFPRVWCGLVVGLLLLSGAHEVRGESCRNVQAPSGCSISNDCLSLTCGFSSYELGQISLSLGLSGLCDSSPSFLLTLSADGASISDTISSTATIQIPDLSYEGNGAALQVSFTWVNKILNVNAKLCFELFGSCADSITLLSNTPLDLSNAEICQSCSDNSYTTSPTLVVVHVIGLLCGGFLCFAGYRFFKIMLFLAGFFSFGVAAYEIGVLYFPLSGEHLELASIGFALVCGLMGGSLFICLLYLGLFLLGGIFGDLLLFLILLLFQQTSWASSHETTLGILALVFFICGGIFALCIQKFLIILATSLGGAFGIMAAIDYFSEGGRAVTFLRSAVSDRVIAPPSCWYTDVVIAIWPVFFVAGCIVQFRVTGRNWDHRTGRIIIIQTVQGTQLMPIPVQIDDDEFSDFNKEYPMGTSINGRLAFAPRSNGDRPPMALPMDNDGRFSSSPGFLPSPIHPAHYQQQHPQQYQQQHPQQYQHQHQHQPPQHFQPYAPHPNGAGYNPAFVPAGYLGGPNGYADSSSPYNHPYSRHDDHSDLGRAIDKMYGPAAPTPAPGGDYEPRRNEHHHASDSYGSNAAAPQYPGYRPDDSWSYRTSTASALPAPAAATALAIAAPNATRSNPFDDFGSTPSTVQAAPLPHQPTPAAATSTHAPAAPTHIPTLAELLAEVEDEPHRPSTSYTPAPTPAAAAAASTPMPAPVSLSVTTNTTATATAVPTPAPIFTPAPLSFDSSFDAEPEYWAGPSTTSASATASAAAVPTPTSIPTPAAAATRGALTSDDYYANPEDFGFAGRHSNA